MDWKEQMDSHDTGWMEDILLRKEKDRLEER